MAPIKKNDIVMVLRGKDAGKTGRVLKSFPRENRALVEGVNLVKKHMRKRSENEPAGIISIPAPLYLSKLALYCPSCKKGVRVGIKVLKDKSKLRICKKCQSTL